jgi:hypothetical protein
MLASSSGVARPKPFAFGEQIIRGSTNIEFGCRATCERIAAGERHLTVHASTRRYEQQNLAPAYRYDLSIAELTVSLGAETAQHSGRIAFNENGPIGVGLACGLNWCPARLQMCPMLRWRWGRYANRVRNLYEIINTAQAVRASCGCSQWPQHLDGTFSARLSGFNSIYH